MNGTLVRAFSFAVNDLLQFPAEQFGLELPEPRRGDVSDQHVAKKLVQIRQPINLLAPRGESYFIVRVIREQTLADIPILESAGLLHRNSTFHFLQPFAEFAFGDSLDWAPARFLNLASISIVKPEIIIRQFNAIFAALENTARSFRAYVHG